MPTSDLQLFNATRKWRRSRRDWRRDVAELVEGALSTDELQRLADVARPCVEHSKYRRYATDDATLRRWFAYVIVDVEWLRETGTYPDC